MKFSQKDYDIIWDILETARANATSKKEEKKIREAISALEAVGTC